MDCGLRSDLWGSDRLEEEEEGVEEVEEEEEEEEEGGRRCFHPRRTRST